MKKAYTLSEVLVVLLVLGIIAAFIIPAVLRTAPDRASLLYKKTFYSMQEAAKEMMDNPDMYAVTINAATGQKEGGLFGNGEEFCTNLSTTLDILGDAKCNGAGSSGDPNFTTTNGVKWYNVGATAFGESKDSYKDIKVECAGIEFKIRIYADGRVSTGASSNTPEKCDYTHQSQWDCENAILKQPFKFREL